MYVCITYVYACIYLFGVSTLTASMYWMREEWRHMHKVLVFMSDFIAVGWVTLFVKENRNICFSEIE